MRTLIVGAGVAGLTLAALLQQRGETPTVIERDEALASHGYMLGLFPLGGRVLHGLGVYDAYRARGTVMRSYNIGSGSGTILRRYDLDRVTRQFGPILGIARDQLIELLLTAVDQSRIHAGVTVTELHEANDAVDVHFSDGSADTFDLVVAADGLHSATRDRILSQDEYAYRDTGWGGWVFWAGADAAPSDAYTEYWGAGRFLGLYPTRDRIGVFIGGPRDTIRNLGLHALARHMQTAIKHPVPTLDAVPADSTNSFFWDFRDCRTRHWHRSRMVLLGDAAAGFLPTAGIGASMAMESAAALNDELSCTDAAHVRQALALYEKRHKQRVEKAQTSSRQLGRLMAVRSSPAAWVRDRLLRFYTLERLVRDIATIMQEPI